MEGILLCFVVFVVLSLLYNWWSVRNCFQIRK